MTWIPCGYCHNSPCVCAWTVPPPTVPFLRVWTGMVTTPRYSDGRLSDADVERIAKRVVELMRAIDEALPVDPVAEALVDKTVAAARTPGKKRVLSKRKQ